MFVFKGLPDSCLLLLQQTNMAIPLGFYSGYLQSKEETWDIITGVSVACGGQDASSGFEKPSKVICINRFLLPFTTSHAKN